MLINLTISTFVRDKISRKKIEHVWPDHEIHSHHLMHDLTFIRSNTGKCSKQHTIQETFDFSHLLEYHI